jgi:flagellar motor switch protein FliN
VSWDKLSWRPAGADDPSGAAPILNELDLLRSALEEAVSSMLMAPVTITGLEIADLESAADLPDGVASVATYELLGKERAPIAIGLDPEGGDHLAGSTFDPGEIGWKLIEALDQAVEAIAGEGLQAHMDPDAAFPADEPLLAVRLQLADAEGATARLVAVALADAPADLGMHLILVKEIGKITMEPIAKAAPAPEPAPAAPTVAAPALAAVGDPMAGMTAPVAAGIPGYPVAALPAGGYADPAAYQAQGYAAPGYPAAGNGYQANVRPLAFDELSGGPAVGGAGSIDLLYGVNLEVTVEIGRTRLPIREVLSWTPGSIVELDKLAGEKVDVLVNGHLIASGEVVVVEENFGVRITEVSARARRLAMGEGAA